MPGAPCKPAPGPGSAFLRAASRQVAWRQHTCSLEAMLIGVFSVSPADNNTSRLQPGAPTASFGSTGAGSFLALSLLPADLSSCEIFKYGHDSYIRIAALRRSLSASL